MHQDPFLVLDSVMNGLRHLSKCRPCAFHHALPQIVVNFRHITELENHGVNRADLNKLMEAGFCTVESVSGQWVEPI